MEPVLELPRGEHAFLGRKKPPEKPHRPPLPNKVPLARCPLPTNRSTKEVAEYGQRAVARSGRGETDFPKNVLLTCVLECLLSEHALDGRFERQRRNDFVVHKVDLVRREKIGRGGPDQCQRFSKV